jgi:hypothetical protein
MTDEELRITAQLASDMLARNLVLGGHYALARHYLAAKDGEAIPVTADEQRIIDKASRPTSVTLHRDDDCVIKERA